MAVRTITFDAATEGANYTYTDFDSGNANYGTTKAAASIHGAKGWEIPATALDYVGILNHNSATKLDLMGYITPGIVVAGSGNEIHLAYVRYDASNEAARVYINSAGALRLRTKGSVVQWTASAALTIGVTYRWHLHLEAGTSATTGVARLAYYVGDSTTAVQDSGNFTGIDVAGTAAVLYNTRLGKLNATSLSATLNMDSFELRTDSDATGAFAPYTPAAAATVRPLSTTDNAGGWTQTGTGNMAYMLADSSDATYITNPDSTTNEAVTFRLPPLDTGSAIAGTFRIGLDTGSDSTAWKLEILQGSTVVATRTGTASSETAADVAVTLTSGEIAAITDRANLRARITAKAA